MSITNCFFFSLPKSKYAGHSRVWAVGTSRIWTENLFHSLLGWKNHTRWYLSCAVLEYQMYFDSFGNFVLLDSNLVRTSVNQSSCAGGFWYRNPGWFSLAYAKTNRRSQVDQTTLRKDPRKRRCLSQFPPGCCYQWDIDFSFSWVSTKNGGIFVVLNDRVS